MAICALLVSHEPHPYPVYYGDFATTPTIQHCKGIVASGSTDPSPTGAASQLERGVSAPSPSHAYGSGA